MNKTLAVVVAAFAVNAWAQVSASVNATVLPAEDGRAAKVQVDVTVTCGFTCPPSAPQLHHGVNGVTPWYVSDPDEDADIGMLLIDELDDDGQASVVRTGLKSGAYVIYKIEGAKCWCGNAVPDAYLDVSDDAPITIPVELPGTGDLDLRSRLGDDYYVSQPVDLQGSDQVRVTVSGCGADTERTLSKGDLNSGYTWFTVAPTSTGTMHVSFTLLPSNVTSAYDVEVYPRNDTVTGGGNGNSNTGGGGGGGEEAPQACSIGLVPLLGLSLLLLRRRNA